jgi:hypothetical protein
MSSTFFYFAYGSNLLSARLRERTPSARALGVGRLGAHALRWHMQARDGSGKCDIVACSQPDSHVLGVVYEVALTEKPALDAAETLGVGYAEKPVHIERPEGAVQALAYHALQTDALAVPYDWYKHLVVSGAREHGFESSYLARLLAAACKADADQDRSARHFKLSDQLLCQTTFLREPTQAS